MVGRARVHGLFGRHVIDGAHHLARLCELRRRGDDRDRAVDVDGIALVMILMALVLTPVCILAAWNDVPEVGGRQPAFW